MTVNRGCLMDEIFDRIKDQLGLFNAMYDVVRIVDPIRKIAYLRDDSGLDITKSVCHGFWQKGSPCDNCISMRAIETKKATTKIEIKGDVVYLIQALPLDVAGDGYVVEILKDITSEKIFYLDSQQPNNLQDYIFKINSQLVIDPLTKIYNRRYIDERFPGDLSRIGENDRGMVMAFGDIDHFKNVNDTYGHLAGDYVLKTVASIIKDSIRETSDWTARYGGEEFLIVLNNVKEEKAMKIIESLREKIADFDFLFDNERIRVTCSFGLVAVLDNKGSFEELFKIADDNLYQAKIKGRNQSVI